MDARDNYSNYRIALRNAKAPVIPYVKVILRDISVIEGKSCQKK